MPPTLLQLRRRASDDWLFRGVVEAVLGEPPVRADKDSQLRRLQQRGVWMIDLKIDPKEHKDEKLGHYVADLVKRARGTTPRMSCSRRQRVRHRVPGAARRRSAGRRRARAVPSD